MNKVFDFLNVTACDKNSLSHAWPVFTPELHGCPQLFALSVSEALYGLFLQSEFIQKLLSYHYAFLLAKVNVGEHFEMSGSKHPVIILPSIICLINTVLDFPVFKTIKCLQVSTPLSLVFFFCSKGFRSLSVYFDLIEFVDFYVTRKGVVWSTYIFYWPYWCDVLCFSCLKSLMYLGFTPAAFKRERHN